MTDTVTTDREHLIGDTDGALLVDEPVAEEAPSCCPGDVPACCPEGEPLTDESAAATPADEPAPAPAFRYVLEYVDGLGDAEVITLTDGEVPTVYLIAPESAHCLVEVRVGERSELTVAAGRFVSVSREDDAPSSSSSQA